MEGRLIEKRSIKMFRKKMVVPSKTSHFVKVPSNDVEGI
jgi:hypothetical protein